MTHTCENIIDQDGIELLVSYDFEKSDSQIEECHGFHEVGNMVYTDLCSVEVIVKGSGIDILPLMNERQKKHIISLLNY